MDQNWRRITVMGPVDQFTLFQVLDPGGISVRMDLVPGVKSGLYKVYTRVKVLRSRF